MASLGALASLAEYSDSDNDSDEGEVSTFDVISPILTHLLKKVVEIGQQHNLQYRQPLCIKDELDSENDADSEEESSNGDDSDDDDNDSSKRVLLPNNKTRTSDKSRKQPKPPPKVKGELCNSDLPPIEDLLISVPEYECIEVGQISSAVSDLVVVKAHQFTAALDLDTVLFLDKGQRPLGKIFDVMGPVSQPFYCVRFNSADHIKEKQVLTGMPVFFAPRTEHTSFVFLEELQRLKGSDASWENDKEPPKSCIDFSDDEEERASKKKQKPPQQQQQQAVYKPPSQNVQSANAFYRRGRRYNPRDFGPITWNSMHTQHMNRPPGPLPSTFRPPFMNPDFSLPPPPFYPRPPM